MSYSQCNNRGSIDFVKWCSKLFKMMVEPNWDYFVNEPLDSGTIRFETKTERALFARVVAGEANWMEQNSLDRLNTWKLAKYDLEAFLDGRRAARARASQ